jgi:hypothetical protein
MQDNVEGEVEEALSSMSIMSADPSPSHRRPASLTDRQHPILPDQRGKR